jgi:hypothetical protein
VSSGCGRHHAAADAPAFFKEIDRSAAERPTRVLAVGQRLSHARPACWHLHFTPPMARGSTCCNPPATELKAGACASGGITTVAAVIETIETWSLTETTGPQLLEWHAAANEVLDKAC